MHSYKYKIIKVTSPVAPLETHHAFYSSSHQELAYPYFRVVLSAFIYLCLFVGLSVSVYVFLSSVPGAERVK